MLVCGVGAAAVSNEAPSVVELCDRRANKLRETNCAVHVEFARSLLIHVEVWKLLSGVHQQDLDQVWGKSRIGFEHQSRSSSYQWSRHRRSAKHHLPASRTAADAVHPTTDSAKAGSCLATAAKIVLLPGAAISGLIRLS